jgi:uncharacterized damage-inducible protein DinB
MPSSFAFLADTYETEILKTLSVWAAFSPDTWKDRPSDLARTAQEQFIHQCLSENLWMIKMLGIDCGPVLPEEGNDDFAGFFHCYQQASAARLAYLRTCDDEWWLTEVPFFDVPRNRAWVMTRLLTHSSHHRGQLSNMVRASGAPLKSTYGPTADTGGLAPAGGTTKYAFASCEEILAAIDAGSYGHGAREETTNKITECQAAC